MDFDEGDIFENNSEILEEKNIFINSLPSEKHFKILSEISLNFYSNLNNLSVQNFNYNFPLKVSYEIQENIAGVFDVVNSDNIFINKIIQVFTIIGCEIENVINENNQYDSLMPLVLYGENTSESDEIEDGISEIQIANMLQYLVSLLEKVKKLKHLSINLINQMLALYNKKFKNYNSSFKNFTFYKPFDFLGRIFGYINTIDQIFNDNVNLQNDWKLYKTMFFRTKSDSIKFGYTDNQSNKLEKIIRQLDNVLSGKLLFILLKRIIAETGEQDMIKGNLIHTVNNKEFCNHLSGYLKSKIEKCSNELNTLSETSERNQLYNLYSVFSYYCLLFESDTKIKNQAEPDKDVYSSFWNIQKKIPTFPIIMHINFHINKLMINIKEFSENRYSYNKISEYKKSQLSKFTEGFENCVYNMSLEVLTWMSKMDSKVFSENIIDENMIFKINDSKLKLIINGMILAYQIKNNLNYMMNTHLSEKVDLKSNLIAPICNSLQLLKIIELQFKKSIVNISVSYDSILNVLYNEILKVLKEIYKKTINGKIDEFKSDFLASLKIIMNNLNFSPSKIRLMVNELCLDLVRNKNFVGSKEMDDLKFNFWRLSLIQNMEKEIKSVCDCGFFFWFRDLYQEFCNHYYKHIGSISNIYYLVFAISDTSEPLFNVLHLEDNTHLMKKYKSDTIQIIKDELFLKIARDIENDLRLHVHSVLISNLNINNNNLLKNSDFSEVLKLRNLKVFEDHLNLKIYVQEYLNKMFYDMTTINLNDWKTYQQMRSLAKSKYGLYLHNVDIPSQTLEQGVDILYILRNISYFVQNYYYNLHSQIFIEVTKENNYLTVIGMQQILNSLNTHGIGIVNSIVNKIYQFLLSKLKKICNVINDEYIKSSLVIEKRFWIENKEDYLNFYPYERSEHLMNDIKQQYGKKGEITIIDQLRELVSQIGNSLGFIRSLKAALNEFQNQNLKYFSSNPNKLNDMLISIKNKDQLTKHVSELFSDTLNLLENNKKEKKEIKNNYLLILVNSFEDVFTPNNIPDIDLFFYLMPALTINAVENMIVAKEKLNKKNNKDAFISDDGFIIGLTYLMKVFKQEVDFNSLHWFDSAIAKFKADEQQFNSKKILESDLQKKMSLKRVEVYKREFELLYYTYTSSTILFNEY